MLHHYLLFRAADRLHALAIGTVIEVMRPSSIDRVEGGPGFVLGVAMIRGRATPVVSAARLFAGDPIDVARRWIHMRAQPTGDREPSSRTIALAVREVIGVRHADELALEACAPLLQEASAGMVEQLGRLDGALLRQLRAGFRVPGLPWGPAEVDEAGP